jgi:cysteinyl-tRNA synthetase
LDELRDESLPSIGIQLEDQPDGSVVFKVGAPEARKPKPKPKAPASAASAAASPPEGATTAATSTTPKAPKQTAVPKPPVILIDPSEHFRAQTEKYSEWNETGFPTKTADLKELTRGQFNKVKKEYESLLGEWKKAHPEE